MDDDIRALLSPEGEQQYLRQKEIDDFDLAELRRRRLELYPEPDRKPVKVSPQPKTQQQINSEWNEWFATSFRAALKRQFEDGATLANLIVGIGKEVNNQDLILLGHIKTLKAEIGQLREQVVALRCDVEVLTKHKASKSDVVPLMRGRDVA